MKKNVLALSITAALIGLAGTAHAMTGTLGGATAASTLALNGDGVGHSLLVPYFTAQNANATLINLVNTDVTNGKAVKVRFRGASNSDDLLDFQVFLSPGDVWAASITQGADGRATLTTNDASCTKPAKAIINAAGFGTARLDSTLSAVQLANGTREGYVEIFNMADIPKAANTVATADAAGLNVASAGVNATAGGDNPLYTAIKHVAGVAPCSGAAWTALDDNKLEFNTVVSTPPAVNARTLGLVPPSTGLVANWTIINTVGAAAWSGEAVAIQSVAAGAAAAGNVVYWPQVAGNEASANSYTSDSLLRTGIAAGVGALYTTNASGVPTLVPAATAPAVTPLWIDLPDLSTPYAATATTAPAQAALLTAAIAASSATNEFLTTTAINASTDWVFSMPTRRYSVAFNYGFTAGATNDGRLFTDLAGNAFGAGTYFSGANTSVSTVTNGNGRQICVSSGLVAAQRDREENTISSGVVVSPAVANALAFCGEATVLSINNGGIVAAGTGALKASVAVKDLDVTYKEGWLKIATPGANAVVGLPVLGSAFFRAANGAQTYGTAYKHRLAR